MLPVNFEGAININKPENMTDDECMSVWAKFGFGKLYEILEMKGKALIPGIAAGIDSDQYPYYLTAWKPSKEDIDAILRGEPIYIKTLSKQLPPMSVFTIDENGQGNF